MSTQTGNVRYVSLFAAASYYRTVAGQQKAPQVPLRPFLRRLEALIAVASVLHHAGGEPPLGIIGRNKAGELAVEPTVALDLKLAQPPYNIYRGSLSALTIIDIFGESDHLYKRAIPLGEAWNLSASGPIQKHISEGTLPDSLSQADIGKASAAFCLCSVPNGSEEQLQLARWLLALDDPRTIPSYEAGALVDSVAWRSVSWRLALELVRRFPGQALNGERLMAHILAPHINSGALGPRMGGCLAVWRWVAARTFFERGWTYTFDHAVKLLRGARAGLAPNQFRAAAISNYQDLVKDEPLDEVAEEAYVSWEDPQWLIDRFKVASPRDHVSLLCASIYAASSDRAHGPNLLEEIWRNRGIPFEQEARRLNDRLASNITAASYWAEIAQSSLTEHLQSSLRKMSAGNPDSRLLDFDEGHWIIPKKAWELSPPYPSGGWNRLDQAHNWARQLGILVESNGDWKLTSLADSLCTEWDQVFKVAQA